MNKEQLVNENLKLKEQLLHERKRTNDALQENYNITKANELFIKRISELEHLDNQYKSLTETNQYLNAKVEAYEKIIDSKILLDRRDI